MTTWTLLLPSLCLLGAPPMNKDIRWISVQKTEVLTAAYAPDGRTIAVAGFDRLVYLLDTTTWEIKRKLEGHDFAISQVLFSPNGKMLASLSPGEDVILWDLDNGKELRRLHHSKEVNALTFTGDGKELVAASFETRFEKTIRSWEVKMGREVRSLPSRDGAVSDVEISRDGKLLAAASSHKGKSGMIQLWDTASWKVVDVLKGHCDLINSFKFSGDGRYLASSGEDGKVFIWDLSRRKDKPLAFPPRVRSGVCFSPKRDRVALTDPSNLRITLWDFALKKETSSPGVIPFPITCLAFSPDGRTLVFSAGGFRTGDLGLWEVPTDTDKEEKMETLAKLVQ